MTGPTSQPASPSAAISRRREAILLALVLVAAAAFRLYRLGGLPMRIDEISTAFISRLPVSSILRYWGGMPLLFLITKACLLLGHAREIIFLPPFLEGMAGVAAVWALGRLMAGPATGLLAAGLAAASPMAIYYAQDARYYAFLMLASTLATIAFLRALERGGSWWTLFGAVSFLNFLNHASSWLLLAGQAVTGAWLILLEIRRGGGGRREFVRRLKPPLVTSLLVTGTYLLVFLTRLLAQESGRFWQRKFHQGGVMAAAQSELATNPDRLREAMSTFGGTDWTAVNLLLAVVCVIMACLCLRRLALFVGTVAVPLAVLVAAGARKWEVRYLIFMLPLYLVFVAEGWRRLVRRVLPDRYPLLRGMALGALAIVLPLLSLGNLREYYTLPKQAWQQAALLLRQGSSPRDLVIVPGPREAEGLLYYLEAKVDPGFTSALIGRRFQHVGFLFDWRRRALEPLDHDLVRRRREEGSAMWRLYWLIENPRKKFTVAERYARLLDRGDLVIPFRGVKSDLLWTVRLPAGADGERLDRWRELTAQARALAPPDDGLRILQAELLLAAGRREEALGELRAAARQRSTAPGLLARGLLEALAGHPDLAARLVWEAQQADPFDLQADLAQDGRTLIREADPIFFPTGAPR